MIALSTLLIVDDNKSMRLLLRKIVERPGLEILEAVNGREGVERYKERMPDLVLMDIDMPILDGISATREIHSFDSNARLLVVTQHDDPSFKDLALSAGAAGFLLKDDLSKLKDLLELLENPKSS